MNNGNLPPGGGGNPPQQPPNLYELIQAAQAQAGAIQARVAAAPNNQNAQLLQLLFNHPQLLAQIQQQQQIAAAAQQVLQQQQQQQQALQQQQQLQNQQQEQQQQLQQIFARNYVGNMQQEQQQRHPIQQVRAPGNIEVLQQLQQLVPLANQAALNRIPVNQPVALNPVAVQVPQAHVPAVPRNPPQQQSPAQRAMAANAPAMNRIENFIFQEEQRPQQQQQQQQPVRAPVQVAQPRVQIQHQPNIHIPQIPLVRVNNLLVQQPGPAPLPQVRPQNTQRPQPPPIQLVPFQQVRPQRQAPPPAPPQQEPRPQQVAPQVVQPQPQIQQAPPERIQEVALPSPTPSPPPDVPNNRRGAARGALLQALQQEQQQEEEEEVDGEEEEEEEEEDAAEGEENQPDQPPRVDEALNYLRVIKQTFQDEVPIYHRFLEIMKEFRAQRLETPDVIEQVAELLYTSPNLVLGFNTFLPVGFRITLGDNGRYLFSSPHHEPKTLMSPEERSTLRENVRVAKVEALEGDQEDDEDDKNDSRMEEDDQGPIDPLVEVVVPDLPDHETAPVEENQASTSSADRSDDVLNVFELLQQCFHARPGKLACFSTFMDMFITSQKYNRDLERRNGEEGDTDEMEDDSNQPGPAPPPLPVDENMEVEEEDGEREVRRAEGGAERVISEEERRELITREQDQFIITLAAKACLGEPELLAALIDFLPYLRKLLEHGSEQVMQKIKEIIESKPTNGEPIDLKMADKALTEKMEQANMGTSKNEKLLIQYKPDDLKTSDEQLILQKSYRILYEKLKLRATATQIKQLVVLLNTYLNMDATKQQLITEVPKIMGRQGSEVESLILNLLGMNKDPNDLPENDVDAVMRKDMPPVRAKRGLRVQKLVPQIKTSDVATVCTLGPSYRLMKDPKEGECKGRIEMEDEIKETLNDKWSSWPSYSSEDTGTQQTKKSNLEEFHFRTEDERYELDIIVDSNRTIMEELDMILRHYIAMSDAERRVYKFNDHLNCQSRSTFFRVMIKVYTNSVLELVEAVKHNPLTGLPKIIAGLQEKDAQWTRFQQDANRTWRDALDKQLGASTALLTNQQKNYDQKAFKSKPLVNAIEQVFEDKKKAGDEDNLPHMTLEYSPEEKVYQDVNDVIQQFFHELPGSKNEGDRSKLVLFSSRVLMEWLCQEQENVTIDESVEKAFKFEEQKEEGGTSQRDKPSTSRAPLDEAEKFRQSLYKRERRVFYGDDAVYLVIRYHHMIQERFAKLLASQAIFSQEFKDSQQKQSIWQAGIGADLKAREALEKNVIERKAAVEDIKNVRHCPSAYYTTTLRELKQLGSTQTDLGVFEDTVRNLFPGDVSLFNNIDKLFTSLAKNIHHASCADGKENPINLYLKYRKRLIETEGKEEREAVEQEYAQAAEEVLRGKNTYRFEFIEEKNAPFINIWVIPREEKESEVDDDDEDGNGNDDKDKNDDDKGDDQDEEMPPANEDNDEEDEEEDGSEGSPSGAEGPEEPTTGEEEMDVETEVVSQEWKAIPKALLSQIKNSPQRKAISSRGIEKISKYRLIRSRDCDKMVKIFTQPIIPLIYA